MQKWNVKLISLNNNSRFINTFGAHVHEKYENAQVIDNDQYAMCPPGWMAVTPWSEHLGVAAQLDITPEKGDNHWTTKRYYKLIDLSLGIKSLCIIYYLLRMIDM